MKPVERLAAVFRFEEPDRVPLYDKFRNAGAIAHYAGEPFVYERGHALGLRACRAVLDATANPIYPQPEGIKRMPDGFVWSREHWTSWIIKRPFHDVDGLAVWVSKEKVIFHSDGNLNAVMDDLVAAEIDGINPLETQAGMDVRWIKERYGKRLVIVGGMDASELLPLGSVDEVRAATSEMLRVAMPGSGFVVGSTTELSNAIPPANIIAMWDTVLEYGRYPCM